MRVRRLSRKTERSYWHWIQKYIVFHGKKRPELTGKDEIEGFLTYLATDRAVSSATRNQAFSALLFLYEQVSEISLKDANIRTLRAK